MYANYIFAPPLIALNCRLTCGQSYKQFTVVNLDSRVVVTSQLLIFTYDSRLVNYHCRSYISLATEHPLAVKILVSFVTKNSCICQHIIKELLDWLKVHFVLINKT